MKFKHSPLLALFAILMLVLSACGGATTPAAAPTAAPAAAPAADAPTAAPAADAPTAAPAGEAPAPEPTQIMQFDQEAPAGAKVVTWMVRSGPDENRWESEVVLP